MRRWTLVWTYLCKDWENYWKLHASRFPELDLNRGPPEPTRPPRSIFLILLPLTVQSKDWTITVSVFWCQTIVLIDTTPCTIHNCFLLCRYSGKASWGLVLHLHSECVLQTYSSLNQVGRLFAPWCPPGGWVCVLFRNPIFLFSAFALCPV
jgi:hypothetical protein